jgi:PAS domain S-box-containing protein
MILAYGLFRHRLLEVFPIARDVVIEKMGDGWMVLDAHNRVVDLNPAAEKLIGLSREKIFGQPAEKVLSNWQNINNPDAKELSIKGSVILDGEWRYLQMRVSPLFNQSHLIGKMIGWRDVTERQKAEEARRQVRDDLFILLHAISGAASRAVNLDDFLVEALYQIVYSFRSQSSTIFLLEEDSARPGGSRLILIAHHGLSEKAAGRMTSLEGIPGVIKKVIEEKEALLIPDISADARIPVNMRQSGMKSLLVVPLLIEEQVIGIISLGRSEGQVYNTDEISRLSAIADEVATFIHSDRQRQLTIALTERERLVRDLHDSVSAKLYGLLQLTEAAQAGLEAGRADMPALVLPSIGDNARQALKEMRLFLHELQPVDLEREGLVSVLTQRLSAVEGRANIKFNLMMDDEISLPVETKVALYFIAQEALNNVLRHANAGSVKLRLEQTRTAILFEVVDDGCGFDTMQESIGGIGLRNMKERASKIGGKFKLISSPGKGTSVKVTIHRNKQPATVEQEESGL